jgi:histidinol-phosphate phosphatase family protein
MKTLQPALFLDRDGVINENRANYVRSWADVALYPQALRALALVRDLPYKIIVVTNQSAVGRGIISLAEAEAINDGIVTAVPNMAAASTRRTSAPTPRPTTATAASPAPACCCGQRGNMGLISAVPS